MTLSPPTSPGRSRAIEEEDAPGPYVVIHSGAVVRREAQVVARLEYGTQVSVLEVDQATQMVFGRIEDPPGWIPLRSLEDGHRWARLARPSRASPHGRAAQDGPAASSPAARWPGPASGAGVVEAFGAPAVRQGDQAARDGPAAGGPAPRRSSAPGGAGVVEALGAPAVGRGGQAARDGSAASSPAPRRSSAPGGAGVIDALGDPAVGPSRGRWRSRRFSASGGAGAARSPPPRPQQRGWKAGAPAPAAAERLLAPEDAEPSNEYRAPTRPYVPPFPRVSQVSTQCSTDDEDPEMQPRGCIGVSLPQMPTVSLDRRVGATARSEAARGEPQEDARAQHWRESDEEALEPAAACEAGGPDGSTHSTKKQHIGIRAELPGAFVCCGHWTARMCCSWCFKVTIMMIILGWFFVWGPLSRPLWMPISLDRACQTCDDDASGKCPKFFQQKVLPHGTRDDCMRWCEATENCNAVDWFRATRYCNLYQEACLKPADTDGNASSWQTGTSCTLGNGTVGILIQGHCNTGVKIPTAGRILFEEVPRLLVSRWSWSCSFLVAFVYSWVRSEWFRKKIPLRGCLRALRCLFCYGSFWARCALAVAILLGLFFWRHERALPPVPKPADFLHESIKDSFAIVLGPALAAMLVCAPLRQCIMAIVVAIGGVIMSCFTSMATLALSLCFDGATLGAEGLLASVFTVGGVDAAVGAGVAGDAVIGAEGAAAADATAVTTASVEAAAAADAAIATDAAIAAEAAAAADTAVAFTLCAVQ